MNFRKKMRVSVTFLAFFSISANIVLLQGCKFSAVFVLFIGRFVNFPEDIRAFGRFFEVGKSSLYFLTLLRCSFFGLVLLGTKIPGAVAGFLFLF